MPNRTVVHHQLDPKVAVALSRIDGGWLIVVNPQLSKRGRTVAEAEAHQYIDALQMGWSYAMPTSGADVCISDTLLSVVGEPREGESTWSAGRLAAGALLPLTGCAALVATFADMIAQGTGVIGV